MRILAFLAAVIVAGCAVLGDTLQQNEEPQDLNEQPARPDGMRGN